MTRAIHQFVPTLSTRDAIGAHVLHVQELLRDMGFGSEIFTAATSSELAHRARHYRRFGWRSHERGSWLLYQSSIGSPVGDFVASRAEPKLVNYHNITPARLLQKWDAEVAETATLGRYQLAKLAPITALGIAVSRFNEAELAEVGFATTTVAPPLIDFADWQGEPDGATVERLTTRRRSGGTDLLFVGRIAPNKAQHDVIKALSAYRRAYDPNARLHLVGSAFRLTYRRALERFVEALGLENAVHFAGSVTDSELAAYYQSADVFVCCSDHEGFCVPLLEAMHWRVPIVAYEAAAVPETVGAAGVVLPDKRPALVAAAVQRVVEDAALRSALIGAGRARLDELSLPRSRARFEGVIRDALEEKG